MLLLVGWATAGDYQVYVSNEKAGDLTVISGADYRVVTHIPVGKRPRGIRVSPDGQTVYVALSGTPIEPPPQLPAPLQEIMICSERSRPVVYPPWIRVYDSSAPVVEKAQQLPQSI